MAEKHSQTYANHMRLHPPFHFFLAPGAIVLLKAQDRVIRLEERLRLQALLNAALVPRISELTEAQLIALRFASHSELPAFVEKALAANMPARDIRKTIVTWRPDTFRV